MFEKLIEIALQFWHNIVPFVVIIQYQMAGVFRFGRYHRTLGPGFHWKYPFVEEVNQQDSTPTTMRLPPQTLTSKDGKCVIAAVIINYQIKDIEKYLCEITDQKDVLVDTVMGAVHLAIRNVDWAATLANPPEKEIVDAVRDRVNKYGFKVHAVTFTDLGEVWSLRLIQPHGKDISN